MPKLLSNPGAAPGFIAKQLGKHLGKQVKPATLIKVTPTARTAGAVSGGQNPTETEHSARGWVEEFTGPRVPGSTARVQRRTIVLLGATIKPATEPKAGDKIRIEGATYRVTEIGDRDPDAATFECICTK